ncbi:MAG TPA: NUDIX domain-containing protein [Verrucomicrobiae bacterium]|nr:NUDIX domain-containing protein [Verrucomicrobiae bacterium]
MSEEMFDVVDENDRVIGCEARADVHRRGLLHRAVHVLVFNSAGELFLQRRSMAKDTFPGAWDSSSSGHLCCGEDYDTCAVRELQEEIGLTPERAPERLFKVDACDETGQEHVWVYRCFCDGPFVLNPEEVQGGEWFSPESVTRWLSEKPEEFASAFRKIWNLYLEQHSTG